MRAPQHLSRIHPRSGDGTDWLPAGHTEPAVHQPSPSCTATTWRWGQSVNSGRPASPPPRPRLETLAWGDVCRSCTAPAVLRALVSLTHVCFLRNPPRRGPEGLFLAPGAGDSLLLICDHPSHSPCGELGCQPPRAGPSSQTVFSAGSPGTSPCRLEGL